ncbi:dnaJ subfamily C member 21-like protein [Leptotrombidium deliense]|uniref:DnaJ subfamily C member 21-like protein n=1 Tax=Leptotrombidium deliense TaxID=299467 RepID=A0A443SNT2_9ACAR|nr:dnaJ subfamily C member 21-like protein [Leptotrombidium deliense]
MCEKSVKQCFYEVLGVDEKASNEELRKNYRLLALRWHPDKNPENSEAATRQFRLIQEAYDCLIDPKERIWYDKHKDAILRGHCRDEIVDKSFDVFPFFVSSCYSGFGDDENGFYTVYRNVFESIANEDLPFIDENVAKAPSFGNSESPYSEVHAFYSYWQSYCTARSYAWLDQYDVLSAPNRRCVRLMEKENKKFRDAGKKKRNEEIRIKEKQKELEAFKESEWTSMSTLEQELQEIENDLEEVSNRKKSRKKKTKPVEPEVEKLETDTDLTETCEKEDLDDVDLYCIACDKTFKSMKSFENHENSKKHKTNIKHLKATLEDDEQLIS